MSLMTPSVLAEGRDKITSITMPSSETVYDAGPDAPKSQKQTDTITLSEEKIV